MTFLMIIIIFPVWLFLTMVSTVASRFLPALRPAYPYMWRIGLWSSVGLFVSSAVLILPLVFGFAVFAERFQADTVIYMSLIGCCAAWLLGVVIGLVSARRKILRAGAEKIRSVYDTLDHP
jgi:hypothetical protein